MSTSERPEPAPITPPWEAIAASAEFKSLLRRKAAFIVPACAFFIVYYFALPILVGFFPTLMKTRIGDINLAYGFALSQFFMVWGIAALYVRVAAKWDKQSAAIIAQHKEAGK